MKKNERKQTVSAVERPTEAEKGAVTVQRNDTVSPAAKSVAEPEKAPEKQTTDEVKEEAARPAETAEVRAEAEAKVEASEPPATTEPSPDIEALIAQAEQRGYLRGRNESIEELMRRPAMMETIAPAPPSAAEPDEEPMILRHRRISIWDK